MCLQNYLIFYLEVIPPLSSFIALYVTEVGERLRTSPFWWLREGRFRGNSGALHLSRPPLPAASCCFPPRSVFFHCPSNCGFCCVSEGEGGTFGDAVTLEWAVDEPQARPSQTRALVWPFRVLVLRAQDP